MSIQSLDCYLLLPFYNADKAPELALALKRFIAEQPEMKPGNMRHTLLIDSEAAAVARRDGDYCGLVQVTISTLCDSHTSLSARLLQMDRLAIKIATHWHRRVRLVIPAANKTCVLPPQSHAPKND